MNKNLIRHELNIFFGNCMSHMHDTKEDWEFVIDWSQRYADSKNNDPEVVEMILNHINQLEKKFNHKNAM